MRYRLRTLLIVLAILLAGAWLKYAQWQAEQERQRAAEAERAAVFSFSFGIIR